MSLETNHHKVMVKAGPHTQPWLKKPELLFDQRNPTAFYFSPNAMLPGNFSEVRDECDLYNNA